jgi:hypothetical protein
MSYSKKYSINIYWTSCLVVSPMTVAASITGFYTIGKMNTGEIIIIFAFRTAPDLSFCRVNWATPNFISAVG